ncbi:MAG: PAS domain-containing protein [Nitrospirae bacterium]|nr:PAS domain-containing protein [Nitrospirota bacterium]
MKRRSTGNKTADQPAASRARGPVPDIQLPLRKDGGALLRPDPMTGSPDDEVLHHLSSLLDSVKTGIISLDGEGRIRVFNAVAEMLFAVHRQAVLGRPFSAMGRMISFKEHSLHALWERLSDAVWAAGAALDLEADLVHPTGQRRIISYSVYPLGRLAWSVGHGVVIMLEDVTRKKEMEDQITDGRKRLQAVFDGITDGIQVVDPGFRITAVNKSMTYLVGGTVSLGHLCYKSCSLGDVPCEDCPAEETFRSGQPASLIRRAPRRSGQPGGDDARVLEISTFPLLDRGGRVVQVVEYIKDVTDRVRLAERLEHTRRLAELGEMAARVAHEVRNPLNAINGAAHFLATEYAGDEIIQKFTSLIKRQSGRVDQVASDILYAAKPLRLTRTSVDVDAVVDQVLASLQEEIRGQGISVERHGDPDLPRLQADELQIEQALTNIVQNAVESMPRGGTLTISTAEDTGGGWLRISVQDTGSGILPQDRDHIFEAFYTTKTKGTGLGLSIVEGVLKNHGGKIFIEQPEGAGTRIVLCLPALNDADTTGQEEPESAPSPRPEASPKKIP